MRAAGDTSASRATSKSSSPWRGRRTAARA